MGWHGGAGGETSQLSSHDDRRILLHTLSEHDRTAKGDTTLCFLNLLVQNRPELIPGEGEGNLLSSRRYRDLLSESVYTLCPAGTNEESYRVWEALEAGSIPIIKSSHAWSPLQIPKNNGGLGPHPLPTVSTWSEAVTMLKTDLPQLGEEVDLLQARVMRWWKQFKAQSQHMFREVLTDYVD